jgi:hypothetical protein
MKLEAKKAGITERKLFDAIALGIDLSKKNLGVS